MDVSHKYMQIVISDCNILFYENGWIVLALYLPYHMAATIFHVIIGFHVNVHFSNTGVALINNSRDFVVMDVAYIGVWFSEYSQKSFYIIMPTVSVAQYLTQDTASSNHDVTDVFNSVIRS